MFKESRHFLRGLSGDRALENHFFPPLSTHDYLFLFHDNQHIRSSTQSPGCLHTPLTFIIWPRWLKNSASASPLMGRTGSFPPMEIPPYLTREQEVLKSGPRTMLCFTPVNSSLGFCRDMCTLGGIVRTSQQHGSTSQTNY